MTCEHCVHYHEDHEDCCECHSEWGVECPTCGGKPWFKKVWRQPDHPDNLITLPDERFDVVPSKCPDCTPENVETP